MTEPSLAAQLMMTGLLFIMPASMLIGYSMIFLEGTHLGRLFMRVGIALLIAAGMTMFVAALGEIWNLFPY